MKKVKVLQVLNELNIGGIQVFVMNVYRNIDRDTVQFDFLLSSPRKGAFEEEIEEMGGHIYRVTPRRESVVKNLCDLKRFFKQHSDYDCVHCHFSNLSYITPLVYAKKVGIPIRIIHSHSTNLPNNIIHKCLHSINKKRINHLATHFFACSDLAGTWLFGGSAAYKKMVLINNGIKTDDYKYNEIISRKMKEKFGVTGKTVYGTVGTFCEAKNHTFIIELFASLHEKNKDSVLLIAVVEPDNEIVKKMITEYNLQDSIKLLGLRSDISDVLQCYDCYLMPSKWEGFPVSLLEAQASGLLCFVSNNVTKQAKINHNVYYLDLDEGVEKWANVIESHMLGNTRIRDVDLIVEAGFDISKTSKELSLIYDGKRL